jgi:hypothetical protein
MGEATFNLFYSFWAGVLVFLARGGNMESSSHHQLAGAEG